MCDLVVQTICIDRSDQAFPVAQGLREPHKKQIVQCDFRIAAWDLMFRVVLEYMRLGSCRILVYRLLPLCTFLLNRNGLWLDLMWCDFFVAMFAQLAFFLPKI